MPRHTLTESQKDELFNASQFRAEMTLSRSPLPAYRKYLKKAETLMHQWFDRNLPIQTLVRGRAWLMDQFLASGWNHLFGQDAGIALLAVGGYGRAELHPHSDIDILILLDAEPDTKQQENIGQFLTLLWDIGLKVGSSVRTLDESQTLAEQDLTIITNLIESRTIAGPTKLHRKMLNRISKKIMWDSKRFLQAKYEEQRERHRKFNDTEYNLEPNLKSSPGGLRDLHMISWVLRRHFMGSRGIIKALEDHGQPLSNLYMLHEKGLLTQSEYRIQERAKEFLWKVRWGLHRLAGRCEDRLLFDYQRALATEFGYEDREGSLAVEQFMQHYFRCVMHLGTFNELLLQHFDDEILNAGNTSKVRVINERFQVRNNYIEIVHPEVFQQHPPALLEMFVLMTQDSSILGARAATLRQLREDRHLVNSEFRDDPRNVALFMELMRAPYGLTIGLRRLVRHGILPRYLPEFSGLVGQMQHDLFHIYTVDAHTLLTVKFLRSFSYKENRAKFPIASKIVRQMDKPELLYLAGLYHDIGKGRGGDHSDLGAQDAAAFAKRHYLTQKESDLLVWLVRNHLIMSTTAQRKDLSDPEVIYAFASQVKTRERLDFLYALTVADINATSPKLWNGWRASLLRQLYAETKRMLRLGLSKAEDREKHIEQHQQAALEELRECGHDAAGIKKIWQALEDDYFLQHSSEEIAWHTDALLNRSRTTESGPLVLLRETTEREHEGGTMVFVCADDRPHLFAACAAALDQLNLSIHDARIFTSERGYSLDSFVVLETNNTPVGNNPERIHEIKQRMQSALQDPDNFPDLIRRRTPRQLKHFAYPPKIIITHEPHNNRTVLEVHATDRPGLLALIGRTFMELGLLLQNAKIITLGEKVEDVFFITDMAGQPIHSPDQCKDIQDTLTEKLLNFARQDHIG
ncbi:[protein-PII] uridylyltransferase [Endozoicomonadaceae bacterium StTr2]